MSNIVAIVGRPNVGKSTLFNRLIGERQAIVDATSGVTRDRHYGRSEWIGFEFSVIDTGGYLVGSDDEFEGEIRKQVQLAIEESDVILFLVDVTEGATPMDEDVADMLRRQSKPVILVANKVDTHIRGNDVSEFYALGLGEIYGISSVNGLGTGDLLDEVVKNFEKIEEAHLLQSFQNSLRLHPKDRLYLNHSPMIFHRSHQVPMHRIQKHRFHGYAYRPYWQQG